MAPSKTKGIFIMKPSVISFKADDAMSEALEKIPNKSEFIRAAVLAALDENCPFCGGTGTLNPHQRKHWASFLKDHRLEHCKECNGVRILCCKHGSSGKEEEE